MAVDGGSGGGQEEATRLVRCEAAARVLTTRERFLGRSRSCCEDGDAVEPLQLLPPPAVLQQRAGGGKLSLGELSLAAEHAYLVAWLCSQPGLAAAPLDQLVEQAQRRFYGSGHCNPMDAWGDPSEPGERLRLRLTELEASSIAHSYESIARSFPGCDVADFVAHAKLELFRLLAPRSSRAGPVSVGSFMQRRGVSERLKMRRAVMQTQFDLGGDARTTAQAAGNVAGLPECTLHVARNLCRLDTLSRQTLTSYCIDDDIRTPDWRRLLRAECKRGEVVISFEVSAVSPGLLVHVRLAARRVGSHATALVRVGEAEERLGFILFDNDGHERTHGMGRRVGIGDFAAARGATSLVAAVKADSSLLSAVKAAAPPTCEVSCCSPPRRPLATLPNGRRPAQALTAPRRVAS